MSGSKTSQKMGKHQHNFLLPRDAYLPGGYASHLLYKKHLVVSSGEHYLIRLIFRSLYLQRYKQTYGILRCAYCGKKNLKINGKNKGATTATLEHIIPLNDGGVYFDPENITIACSKCNNRRGSKKLTDDQAEKLRHQARLEQRLLRLRHRDAPNVEQIKKDFTKLNLRQRLNNLGIKAPESHIREIVGAACPF